MERSLGLITVIALASLTALAATMQAAIANEVVNGHGHTTENTKKGEFLGEHSNNGFNENIGGKDGLHENDHCVFNSNNDKGQVCRENIRDR